MFVQAQILTCYVLNIMLPAWLHFCLVEIVLHFHDPDHIYFCSVSYNRIKSEGLAAMTPGLLQAQNLEILGYAHAYQYLALSLHDYHSLQLRITIIFKDCKFTIISISLSWFVALSC